jgi:hypothetical protein
MKPPVAIDSAIHNPKPATPNGIDAPPVAVEVTAVSAPQAVVQQADKPTANASTLIEINKIRKIPIAIFCISICILFN